MAAVPPGKHEVMYVYSVPYEDSFLEYEKTWRYGTGSLRVVAEEGLVDFQTDLGVDYQSLEIGGIGYRIQEAPDIQRGLKTIFRLTDLPEPTFRESLSQGYNARFFRTQERNLHREHCRHTSPHVFLGALTRLRQTLYPLESSRLQVDLYPQLVGPNLREDRI